MSDTDGGRLVPRFMQGGATPPTPTPAAPTSGESDDTRAVRPFLVTGGRTAADPSLRIETQLVAVGSPADQTFEKASLLQLAVTPVSVAEVSAHLRLPIGAVNVLAADLIAQGALRSRQPQSSHDPSTIRKLIDAVSSL